jgi:hypothetical protein
MTNLQQTLNWAAAFINYLPQMQGGLEPAMSSANLVMQTILGPPFCWRWNRLEANFVASQTGPDWNQDYGITLPTFGFIEKAWVTTVSGEKKELTVRTALAGSTELGRPEFIAAQYDDNAGTITFRLMPVPNEALNVTVLIQKKATLMTSLASTWAPIPDEQQYIYNYGFLALAAILADDQRFEIFNRKFLSHLLGAQEGIDEMQRSIFLGNWLEITKQLQSASAKTNQGIAARQN